MRSDPARLPPGMLAHAVNARMEGTDLETPRGCISLGFGSAFAGTFDEEGVAQPPFAAWTAAGYAAGAEVSRENRLWLAPAGAEAEDVPGESAAWVILESTRARMCRQFQPVFYVAYPEGVTLSAPA